MKKFSKVIAVIAIIVILILVIKWISGAKNEETSEVDTSMFYNSEMFADMDEVQDEKLAEEASDIEGWTKLDKKNAGLSPYDDADTDHDGLTDKEEIEVYGSDPTKTSTSGDLYSDGYKVVKGLDLNKFYEDSSIYYYYDIPEDIKLYSEDAQDNIAEVQEYPVGDTDAYRAYYITKYSGKSIKINVSDICTENDVKESKIGCYIHALGDNSSNIYCDYKVKDGVLTLENEFSFNGGYIVYVTNKSNMTPAPVRYLFGDEISLDSITGNGDEEEESGGLNVEEEGLVLCLFPFTHVFFKCGIKPLLYYYDTGDTEKNQEEINKFSEWSEYYLLRPDLEYKIKEASLFKIIKIHSILADIGDGCFNSLNDDFLTSFLFSYTLLSEYQESVAPEVPTGHSEQIGFDIVKDTLPFPNFGTKISSGGNCMGIATLIAKLYNTGENSATGVGEYTDLSWDLSIDEENNTLTDIYLDDYKTADFKKQHLGLDGNISYNLSDGEKEFLRMVGSYFIDGNAKAEKCTEITPTLYKTYSMSRLNDVLTKYFNENKVLTLCMYSWDGGRDENNYRINTKGHAVNIYGFTDNRKVDGTYTIDVYDNNLPGELSKGLKVDIYPDILDSFNFEFNGGMFDGEYYGYSSYDHEAFMFVILDEDQNIVYGTDDDLVNLIRPATEEEIMKDELRKEAEYWGE